MDAIEFENLSTGKNFQNHHEIFESNAFDFERQQANTQFRMLFEVPVVEKNTKCANPLCQSFTFVQHFVQGRADEPAVELFFCSQCGRKQ